MRPKGLWHFMTGALLPSFIRDIPFLLVGFITLVAEIYVVVDVAASGVPQQVEAALIALVALVGLALAVYVDYRFFGIERQTSAKVSMESQLKELAVSLVDLSRKASTIESDIQARQRAFEVLQAKSQEYEQLAKVNREEAEAVANVVEGAVVRRERGSLVLNTLIAFAGGVLAGLAIDPIKGWLAFLLARVHH